MSARDEVLGLLERDLRAVKAGLPDPLPEDALLTDELRLDSLDVLEFVARVEQRWRVPVPNEKVTQLKTLGQVADHVLAQMAAS